MTNENKKTGSNIEPEKLDLTSLDVATEKKQQLKALFPEVFTEGGKIDPEKLKLTLGEAVDTGKERYGLNRPWKGRLLSHYTDTKLRHVASCKR